MFVLKSRPFKFWIE